MNPGTSTSTPEPTERELQILSVLWEQGECTVRQVHESLRDELGIVQNTVQAFLRTMTEKRLVAYRKEGRTFYYSACVEPKGTKRRMLGTVLQRAFDGALDQLIESAIELRKPTPEELERLRRLVDDLERRGDA
ncbi:MAG: BlaI/MecI/CopY family transcriptional regulator [Planctomycetes bacterium]|nr:BlaI/MecI/CopY family transcriptional regulator [Planctomycetota bacterium]MCB9918055.1 BlaI/MecI/CopY family transcriptional regulator [Planctomycetota bacterium]